MIAVASCGGEPASPAIVPRVVVVSGQGQTGEVGVPLAAPIVVRIADQNGAPMSGVGMTWTAAGGGSASGSAASGADGLASAVWTLDTVTGSTSLSVRVAGAPGVPVQATAVAGPPVRATLDTHALAFASLGDAYGLRAVAHDRYGNPVGAGGIWSSSDTDVASMTQAGVVIARANGSAWARVAIGTGRDSASVTVAQVVRTVRMRPRAAAAAPGDTVPFSAVARDARGHAVAAATISWESASPAVATVDAGGVVVALGSGTTSVTARAADVSDATPFHVGPKGSALTVDTLIAGGLHACAISSGTARCWGSHSVGALGAGSLPDVYNPVPQPVAGAVSFTRLAAGYRSTCGLSPAGHAYCWGTNRLGQAGRPFTNFCGLEPCEPAPNLVTDTLVFTTVATGRDHVCGLTAAGATYCWGGNRFGQLGVPPDTEPHPQPRLVASGFVFVDLRAGWDFTCGLTTAGSAHCWGDNARGELARTAAGMCIDDVGSSVACSLTPLSVPGVPAIDRLRLGPHHACGLTSAGVAYCWGDNSFGQLGNGLRTSGIGPATAVAGGHLFLDIAPHSGATCAVAVGGVAYCWGYNGNGALGAGSDSAYVETVPVPVFGTVRFVRTSAFGAFTCAVTESAAAYCWGVGVFGELGYGLQESSSIPVRVIAP